MQRVLKFVRYLPEYEWLPTVLTVDPAYASYPSFDPTLLQEIPSEVAVVRTRAWDPYGLYARLQGSEKDKVVEVGFVKERSGSRLQAIARWIRGNVFLPDARIGWTPFAKRAARKTMRAESFDAIITSGPPHSAHLVGYQMQSHSKLPWIVDMRDPWAQFYYNREMKQSLLARKVQARMERRVLERASAVVSVSDAVGQSLQRRARIRRYQTIHNGFDPVDFSMEWPRRDAQGPFTIAHVGTFTLTRHAPGLVRAIEQLQASIPIEIHFVGHVHEAVIAAYQEARLSVVSHPYLPRSEAVACMRSADLLLVALERSPGAKGIVTGKVFEYLAVRKPILGIGPPDGDMADILNRTQGGRVFHYDDVSGISTYIADRIARRRQPFNVNEAELKAYERSELTGALAGLLNSLTTNS